MKHKQLEMWPKTRSQLGKTGYLVSVAKMGKFEFHSAGGIATTRMYLWSCLCHGVGVDPYLHHHKGKGKKHRYG